MFSSINKTLIAANSFVDSYLQLLKFEDSREPSIENLSKLMERQIETSLFDCSVFFLKEPQKIILNDYLQIFEKIKNNSGAICFELNHVFKVLLTKLGYDVSLVSTKLFHFNEDEIPPYQLDVHCALLVNLKGKQYLVDVGWGSFRHPIPLDEPMQDPSGTYKLEYNEKQEKFIFYRFSEQKKDWLLQYIFAKDDISPNNFRPNCDLIGSDAHHLSRKLLILQPGKDYSCKFLVGMKGDKLFFVETKTRKLLEKIELENTAETRQLIKNQFGIDDDRIEKILTRFFEPQNNNDLDVQNGKIFGIS